MGWFKIHASARGEERAKHQAARIKKEVVGTNGTKIPKIPSATINIPRQKYTGRNIPMSFAGFARPRLGAKNVVYSQKFPP